MILELLVVSILSFGLGVGEGFVAGCMDLGNRITVLHFFPSVLVVFDDILSYNLKH